MTTLVDRIKSTAKDKYGWNLKTTAQRAGIGVNSIYRWKTQSPTTQSLKKVADVLNVSTDYLLNGENTSEVESTDDNSATGVIAAHIDDDTPEEEQQQIINFIENLKKARGGQN